MILWTSESTLLCAVMNASKKLSNIQIGSSVIKDIAVAIENPKALWPLGIPPFKGVPSPNIALAIIVAMHTIANTISIVYGSEFLTLVINTYDKLASLSQNITYPTISAFIAVIRTAPAAAFLQSLLMDDNN